MIHDIGKKELINVVRLSALGRLWDSDNMFKSVGLGGIIILHIVTQIQGVTIQKNEQVINIHG